MTESKINLAPTNDKKSVESIIKLFLNIKSVVLREIKRQFLLNENKLKVSLWNENYCCRDL